jgi:guanylate kinase
MISQIDDRVRNLSQKFSGLASRLVIISGPSAGAGKGKVIDEVLEMAEVPLWLSISSTTRQPRPGEVKHHSYTFVAEKDFESLEAAGEFLEANGATEGNRYGTPLQPILDHLKSGDTVVLEIEINGAHFVHSVVPEALYIFIKPTHGSLDEDLAELRRRISGRGTEDIKAIDRRLAQAAGELRMARELNFYDEWVVNAAGRSEEAARTIYGMIKQRAGRP